MPFKTRVGSDGVKPIHDRESPNQPFKVYKEKTYPKKNLFPWKNVGWKTIFFSKWSLFR